MAPMLGSEESRSFDNFVATISDKPGAFLHPSDALYASSLLVAKRLTDPLAAKHSVFDQLYTEGLHVDQIWEQLKMITENVVEDVLAMELPEKNIASDTSLSEEQENAYANSVGSESDFRIQDDAPGILDHERDSSEKASEDDEEEEDEDELMEGEEDDGEFPSDLLDEQLDDGNDNESDVENVLEHASDAGSIEVSKNSLNDSFFNQEEFEKQLDLADSNYAQEQSEDDIDYNADPEEASDAEDLDMDQGDAENPSNMYAGWWEPPKKSGRTAVDGASKRKRAQSNRDDEDEDVGSANDEAEEDDEEHTMAHMQKDLFADDADDAELEAGPKLSAHAKRQRRLAEEIRQLENDNVAKKDWTLMGEASARARPKDSLLEEGLDFERTSRPVPIVTEEVTQTLEDMIRARIVEGRFDTVLRKIPESAHKFTKNSFELDETKPSQSLAEVYETEFQKKQNPNDFKTAEDKKLDQEHQEVQAIWRDICYNLDSLSSWHYTPKPVTETLTIVTNAPAIQMEDAQPLTMSSASRLAPQEQFQVSAEKGEVTTKSGLPVSKTEMSSEDRQRYRRKQRAVAKKSAPQKQAQMANMSKAKQEQAGVVDTLKKANVKVIRNGKTKDLKSGKDYTGRAVGLKPSNLKL